MPESMRKKSSGSRTPPYDEAMEQALIGCCVLEGGQESIAICLQNRVSSDSFYCPAHRIIFDEILSIYKEGKPLNELILGERLGTKGKLDSAGGLSGLSRICDRIDNYIHLSYYVERIRGYELVRRLIDVARGIVERAYESTIEISQFLSEAEEQIYAVSRDVVQQTANHIKPSIEKAVTNIEIARQRKGQITGISSGFVDLDKLTSGFHEMEVIIVAARPSMGKTSLALNMAESAILPKGKQRPVPTLFFSLEMSADQLSMRLLCSRAGINLSSLRDGYIPSGLDKKLSAVAQEFCNAPLWIDESSSLNILEMRARARRMHGQHRLGMIIIDYLQLISGTDNRISREQQVSEISRGVKAMAKELRVPVVLLSQLNRESEREKRQPRLSDLRESGSIEQDADVVLLLAKPTDYDDDAEMQVDGEREDAQEHAATEGVDSSGKKRGKPSDDQRLEVRSGNSMVLRELIIAKQRNGPVGIVPLMFDRALTKFQNCDYRGYYA
ncbi:MAG: replicative DNA helicase [Puniceicoccales bacterium]|jgi:replicative DNA helicase|nr:replicative DNA helicase [Puniceicoccales bacterium]